MPIFNGEQPTPLEPELIPAPDNRDAETGEIEQLRQEVETAKENFLKIAVTQGPSSEIAIEEVGKYHDLLQVLAEEKDDREFWLCTEIHNTFVEANEANPAYQDMVNSSKEDLDMVQQTNLL